MDPYRTAAPREPTDNPAQALGVPILQTVPEDHVDLRHHYGDRWWEKPQALVKIPVPAYIVDLGGPTMIVPIALYQTGTIASQWTLAGDASRRLPATVMNDLLGLRDGRWVFLMKRPDGAEKWPTMAAAEVAAHLCRTQCNSGA